MGLPLFMKKLVIFFTLSVARQEGAWYIKNWLITKNDSISIIDEIIGRNYQ